MDCLFCKIVKGEVPSNIIYEDDLFLAFLDINQSIEGHTLIIPKKHFDDYTLLDNDTLNKMMDVSKKVQQLLMDKLSKTAMTLQFNYGESQEIKHVHLHLLPNCYLDDVNSGKSIDEIMKILKGEN